MRPVRVLSARALPFAEPKVLVVKCEPGVQDPCNRGPTSFFDGRVQVPHLGNANELQPPVPIVGGLRLLIYLFSDGPDLACEDAADFNDDGDLGLGDAILELTFLFQEGTPPDAPAPDCGVDPSIDMLECASYPECE